MRWPILAVIARPAASSTAVRLRIQVIRSTHSRQRRLGLAAVLWWPVTTNNPLSDPTMRRHQIGTAGGHRATRSRCAPTTAPAQRSRGEHATDRPDSRAVRTTHPPRAAAGVIHRGPQRHRRHHRRHRRLLAGLVSVIEFGIGSAIESIAAVLVALRLAARLCHGVADERKEQLVAKAGRRVVLRAGRLRHHRRRPQPGLR